MHLKLLNSEEKFYYETISFFNITYKILTKSEKFVCVAIACILDSLALLWSLSYCLL